MNGCGIEAASFFLWSFFQRGQKKDTADSPDVDHQSFSDQSPENLSVGNWQF
jgi:hypothetical protein